MTALSSPSWKKFQPLLEKNPGLHFQDPVLTFFVDITSRKLPLKQFPVPTSPTQSYHDNHTPAHQVTACHLILQFPLYLMASYHHFLLLFNLSVCVLFISLRLSYHASRSSSDITVSVPLYLSLTMPHLVYLHLIGLHLIALHCFALYLLWHYLVGLHLVCFYLVPLYPIALSSCCLVALHPIALSSRCTSSQPNQSQSKALTVMERDNNVC